MTKPRHNCMVKDREVNTSLRLGSLSAHVKEHLEKLYKMQKENMTIYKTLKMYLNCEKYHKYNVSDVETEKCHFHCSTIQGLLAMNIHETIQRL